MDIVQARKKAREKAEAEAKARRPEPEVTAPPPTPPALPKKPPKKAKAPPAEVSKPVLKEKSPTPPRPAPSPESLPVEDVFLDMSFGEDLPIKAEAEGDFELRPADEKALQRPSTPKPSPAPKAPPPPKAPPEPPRAKPAPAKASPPSPPRPEPAAAKGPLSPAPAKAPVLTGLDGEKDFLELVSEDLYRREFGEETQEERGEQLELLSFQLSSETYAIRLTHVQQIIKLREITLVPRAPSYILGVISLRGMIIPIFDLYRRLGLAARESTRETRIIVVMEGTKTIGLIVDRVQQVVRLPAGTIEPPPPVLGGLESEYIEGIGRYEGRMLILLNLNKVLAAPTVH